MEAIPPQMGCCGLIYDLDATVKDTAQLLQKGWAVKVNEEHFQSIGYKISVFVWTWSNVNRAAENAVLLIRFHSLKESRR